MPRGVFNVIGADVLGDAAGLAGSPRFVRRM